MEIMSQTVSKLRVQNLSKYFAAIKAVNDVSFELNSGEILGLIGPNGSGKTTLINVVTGLLKKTEGSVFVDGLDTTKIPNYNIAKSGIARTFQTIRLFKELSVLENVEVSKVCMGSSRRSAQVEAKTILDEVGLNGQEKRLSGELSYGDQRRLEIARALALSPKFLLLDEPAAGLNEAESDHLLEFLKTIPNRRNVGMLIVDHDMRLIMRLCSRLHVLNYGKTIAEGSPDEIRENQVVKAAYLGKASER